MHAHEPDTIYVVLITSDAYHYPPEALRVYRSRMGGTEWEALTRDCRNGATSTCCATPWLSIRSIRGVYVGTTGGQVYGSADAGDSWTLLVRDLPPVLSGEVRRCHDPRCGADPFADTWRVEDEVQLHVEGPVTQRAVLDALEARYPMQVAPSATTACTRRAFVRFFACEQDLSTPRWMLHCPMPP